MTGASGSRVALVTGGSRGIGAGIVRRLVADGARVGFTYARSGDRAAQLVAEVVAGGGEAVAIRADSGIESDVVSSVAQVVGRFGGLDILINNAGGGEWAPLRELPVEVIDRMVNVNIRAVVIAIREALLYLPDGGRIVNIGSINADRMPFVGGGVYAMTKGAVASLTRGLARELAPRRITINNVQPGPVDTEANPAGGPAAASMLAVNALQRFGTTAEIGALVSFLVSADAGYITGTSIDIDGGHGA